MKNFLAIFWLLIFTTFQLSFAETNNEKDQKIDLGFDPQIFSLSKRKERAFDATAANYVLSGDDIRRSGATSIPEALRLVPGVQVARMDGNKWAITIRGFDRQFSNKLLVMIDGRTVYTTLFSGVFWDIQDYALNDIDHIEVIRGPGATIWGPNAVNGVINIITKNADDTRGSYASQIAGNQDKSITEVRFGSATSKNDSYRVYAKKLETEGLNRSSNNLINNEDGIKRDQAGFRYDVSSIENNKISIHGDVAKGVAKNYFASLQNRNDKDSHSANLVINWDKKISKESSIILNGYYDYDQFSLPVLSRSAQTIDLDFQHFYNFSKDNQFIWGAGYRNINDRVKFNNDGIVDHTDSPVIPIAYTPSKRNDNWVTGFIQEKYGIIPDELYVTVGSKFLRNTFTEFEYQPNIRLVYYPERKQTVWASVSRAVRTPTRGERDITIKNANSAPSSRNLILNQGNGNYRSEKEIAYELGYRFKPTKRLSFDLATFYNEYSKLRTFEPNPGSTLNPTADNLGFGKSYGFEFVTKWQPTRDLKLEGSYEYFKMRLGLLPQSRDNASLIGTSDSLQIAEGHSPKHQIKLRAFYNITSDIEFDNMMYFVDNLEKGLNSSTTGTRNVSIPTYTRFDTRLGYNLTQNLNLSFGIQNLFDQRHTEFKNALYNYQTEVGRTFYFKAMWQH
ncbi:MAG: TonB-dependent receptor [Alphaproteobacteria bacterium]|nr:TonB-dependent receptor [Alphaproteobacteria bacterium]